MVKEKLSGQLDAKFDERYDNTVANLTTLYFTAPIDTFVRLFPNTSVDANDICMEVCVEFPLGNADPELAEVSISPVCVDEDGTKECYDWQDVELPYDEVKELIQLAN